MFLQVQAVKCALCAVLLYSTSLGFARVLICQATATLSTSRVRCDNYSLMYIRDQCKLFTVIVEDDIVLGINTGFNIRIVLELYW